MQREFIRADLPDCEPKRNVSLALILNFKEEGGGGRRERGGENVH